MKFKLEKYKCAVCGTEPNRERFELKGFKIVQCTNCEFVYVNPRVCNEDLPKMYSTNYFHNTDFGYEEYEETASLRIRNFKKWYSELEPFVKNNPGKALDIGCASGHFLEILREKKWDVEGIELDTDMVKVLQDKNIPVYGQPFETFNSNKKYDLITLFDVMEHLPDPHAAFKKLSEIIADDGVIGLITPNFNSFQRKIFGKKWFQFKPMEHIHYFTKETLERVGNEYGLKMIHHKAPGQYADTDFLLNRLQRYNFGAIHKVLNAGVKLTKTNISWYADTGSILAIFKKDKP